MNLDSSKTPKAEWFRASYVGKFYAPRDGYYNFHMGSDDGSRLVINGKEVINMWWPQWFKWKSTRRYLIRGWHEAHAEMFQTYGAYKF